MRKNETNRIERNVLLFNCVLRCSITFLFFFLMIENVGGDDMWRVVFVYNITEKNNASYLYFEHSA